MPINFLKKPLKWLNGGKVPSDNLINNGFKSGYKPPAEYFNYQWNNTYECIAELQEQTSELDIKLDYKQGKSCITIAAKDTPDIFKRSADYVCTGLNDDIIINQALKSAKSVCLLGGKYNLSNSISVSTPNTVLYGIGNDTVINIEHCNIVIVINSNNVTIKDMQLNNDNDIESGFITLSNAKYTTIDNIVANYNVLDGLPTFKLISSDNNIEYIKILNSTFVRKNSGLATDHMLFSNGNGIVSGCICINRSLHLPNTVVAGANINISIQ